MGHKPDRKARRKRREREARREAASAPPGTVRRMLEEKRALISKNRADFLKKLKEAPEPVQSEYRRCRERIRRLLKAHAGDPSPIDSVLYPLPRAKAVVLSIYVAWLLDLLTHPANGWDVALSKPLGDGDITDAKLIFRFAPHGD